MAKKVYTVVIPIAGHLFVTVEADNEDEAKNTAFEKATIDDLESWEIQDQWEIEVIEE